MSCSKRRIKDVQYCAGDLRHYATIQNRALTPSNDSADYTLVFSGAVPANEPDAGVWVGIQTVNGVTIFDGSDVERVITAKIVMRFRDDVTAQNWLLIDGIRYDIYKVENINKLSKWLVLYCTERGTANNSVNAA